MGTSAFEPIPNSIMNLLAARSLLFSGVLIVIAPLASVAAEPPADAQAARRLERPAGLPADGGTYQVHGIVQIGPVFYVSLKGPYAPHGRWCQLHEVFGDQVVDEITAERVVLRNRQTGRQQTLRPIAVAAEAGAEALAGAAGAADSPGRVPFSKAWINSNENPMVHGLQQLPIEIVMEWTKLPKEQKEAVIDYYLKHGWRLLGVETVAGSNSFHWENIYEKERSAAISANRREFEASLSEQQKAAYEAIKHTPMMHVQNGQITPEQEIERKRRGEVSAKFKASLSPEQRAMQDGITDFTKRLGVPDAK